MMTLLHRLAPLAVAVVVAGCASQLTRVDTGEVVVGERMSVQVDRAWNRMDPSLTGGIPQWTIDGMAVDTLRFFVGVKDGQPLLQIRGPVQGGPLPPFKSTMQPQEIAGLLQAMWTRNGSTFALERIEPAEFLGGPGFRFDYSLIVKSTDVRMRGVAWGTVRQGELFAIVYMAPRLSFFDRHAPQVEAIVRSARLRG